MKVAFAKEYFGGLMSFSFRRQRFELSTSITDHSSVDDLQFIDNIINARICVYWLGIKSSMPS